MAGTIFSLALSQRFDAEGNAEIDAPLYIYEAASDTPVIIYSDFALSLTHPWPLRTDGNGMFPAFWLPDGQYRVRFTDAAGSVVYFDIPSVQAVGPSTGQGGGGGSSVDPNSVYKTGDPLWGPVTGARTGWVRGNGRTIGSATSGATERANSDVQPLYEFFWNKFDDTLCPVTGGRGASAAADFAANKPIATLDMRGYGPLGLDDMGNSAAGRITDGTPTTPGTSGGSEKRTLIASELPANIPNTLSVTGSPSLTNGTNVLRYNGSSAQAGGIVPGSTVDALSVGIGTLAVAGAINTSGGSAHNIMGPYRLGTWYFKL